MPDPPTPEEIKELRRLEAEATPPPWAVEYDEDDAWDDGPSISFPWRIIGICDFANEEASEADASITAVARNALPRLLDEIERLREENYLLRIHLNAIREKAAMAQMHGGQPVKKDAMILAETVREWANEAFRQVERLAALARGAPPMPDPRGK